MFVCAEKAAGRAEWQLSAHVVNIRNQTGDNRMQVRLAIAFICAKNPQRRLIISYWYIGKVCKTQAVSLEERLRRAKTHHYN